jgi:hypothetical protein
VTLRLRVRGRDDRQVPGGHRRGSRRGSQPSGRTLASNGTADDSALLAAAERRLKILLVTHNFPAMPTTWREPLLAPWPAGHSRRLGTRSGPGTAPARPGPSRTGNSWWRQ